MQSWLRGGGDGGEWRGLATVDVARQYLMPRHRRTRGDADHDASYTSTVLSVETIRMEVIQEIPLWTDAYVFYSLCIGSIVSIFYVFYFLVSGVFLYVYMLCAAFGRNNNNNNNNNNRAMWRHRVCGHDTIAILCV